MELVAESLGMDMATLQELDAKMPEFQTGEIRFYLHRSLTQSEIDQLTADITAEGVYLTAPIVQDAQILVVSFQKRVAPLLIITGFVIATVMAVGGYQVFLSAVYGIPLWVWIAGGVLLLYMFAKSDAGKAVAGAGTTFLLTKGMA